MNLKDNLEKKYIAFLDVLGFKDLVFKSNTDSLENYFESVRKSLNVIGNEKQNIESLLISDSTILISPDTKSDFKTLTRAVQTIQATLAQKDIWLRGAISYGEVYFDKNLNLVVGKGLVKAYLLESKAIFPRVIIDPSIVPKIGEDRTNFRLYLNPDLSREGMSLENRKNKLVDEDENAFYVSFGSRLIYDSILNRNIHLIYNRVKKSLYSGAEHYSKYVWIKNHLNKILVEFLISLQTLHSNKLTSNKKTKSDLDYITKWQKQFREM